MPNYNYTARNQQGALVNGQIRAINEEELAQQLISSGLTPLEISTTALVQKTEAKKKFTLFKGKVTLDELHIFCRQMYALTHAGVPITLSVTRLAETTRNKKFSESLNQIVVELNKGSSLYTAMSHFPDIFSDSFINLISVGENTGNLDNIFLHLAQYLELESDIRKKIKTALRYPIMVLSAIVIALIIINVFVIPSFAKLYASLHGTLPLPTRILLTTSNIIIHYWYLIIGIIIGLAVAVMAYIRTPEGALRWGYFQLKIPIIGWLIHRMLLARFARILSLVLQAGITMVEGIHMVGVSTNNAYIAKKILDVTDLIVRGNTISAAMDKTMLFPPLVIQMLTLGEESGTIEQLLDEVANYYQREIDYDFARLSDAIEPILLVIIGGMVLILALGIYAPIWNLATVINQH